MGINTKIEQPEHYAYGDIECIDYIKDLLGDSFVAHCQASVIKYLHRWNRKHERFEDQVADLKKARFYLDKMIEDMETHGQIEFPSMRYQPNSENSNRELN